MNDNNACYDTAQETSAGSKIRINNIKETFGRRRKLMKSLLHLEAVSKARQESTPEVDRHICYSSEYNDNYCNFTVSQSTKNDEIRMKYPLYGGSIQTVYSQLISEGLLKNRDTIADVNAPFKRNSVMSLSLEDSFN